MSFGLDSFGLRSYGLSQEALAAGGGTTVSPGVGQLEVTGYAPTIAQSANQTVSPGTGVLEVTGYAPSIAQTAHRVVSPATGEIVITGYAPTIIQVAGSQVISPATAELTITTYAPVIRQEAGASAFSGGYFAEVPQVRRKKTVQQEREELGITARVEKVIKQVAKKSVAQVKTESQAEGLLRSALARADIQIAQKYKGALQSERNRLLEQNVAVALLIRKKEQEARRKEMEEDESDIELLLL
jgi:hypothetical protein